MVTRVFGNQLHDDGAARVRITGGGFSAKASFARTADILVYAAGDVIGAAVGATAALTFAAVGPVLIDTLGALPSHILLNNADLRIDGTTVIAGMTTFRLHLYDVTPPSALGDNVPWDLPAGDRASYLGFVDLGTIADLGSTLFTQAAPGKSLLLGAAGSLFGYLVTVGTYTPESGTVHALRINTESK